MDIVSRLKTFLNENQIAITQFADNCGIPRPTLSQLLNGRNKKVSDDLIRKIHDNYPNLSVLWLMFGEGPMSVANSASDAIEINNDQREFTFESEDADFNGNNNREIETAGQIEGPDDPHPGMSIIFDDANIDHSNTTSHEGTTTPTSDPPQNRTISVKENKLKRIVNIIVYYDDNSFESFLPK